MSVFCGNDFKRLSVAFRFVPCECVAEYCIDFAEVYHSFSMKIPPKRDVCFFDEKYFSVFTPQKKQSGFLSKVKLRCVSPHPTHFTALT